ncbi:cytochrome O ubiquinol oxidase, partial [Acinetobacter baumannii]|nr:cytochrome O ubiquinol oxidase [Acinetobacter baumannii]
THLIFGIIIISILPGVIGFIRQKLKNRKANV